MSMISKQSENELSILAIFLYRSKMNLAYSRTCKDQREVNPAYSTPQKDQRKQILFIPQIGKIEAKGTLLIPEMRKIEAKQTLFIPQIQNNEVERTLFIPQIGKINEVCLFKNLKRWKRSELGLFQKIAKSKRIKTNWIGVK
jgi:hypothetical protein